ncbi:MAG: ATP-dependent DNA helicase [Lachnospiraceae bacterium]|nr:ATP-dependent DNA helicase [Lachnospiraceae bacterium]
MEEIQKVRISVRNLVEFILRAGDIDNRRGSFGDKEAMQEGSRIHRKIQKEMGSGYQAEVPLSVDVKWEADSPVMDSPAGRNEGTPFPEAGKQILVLTVEGRADGIFAETPRNSSHQNRKNSSAAGRRQAEYAPCEPELFCVSESVRMADSCRPNTSGLTSGPDEKRFSDVPELPEITYIDEIKGIYRDVMSLERPYPVHLAQAKCYAYIYGIQHELSHMGVQMTYCTLGTDKGASSRRGQAAELRSKTRGMSSPEADEKLQIRRFRQIYEMRELESWFMDVAGQYRKWAQLEMDWKKIRQASIRGLEFPYQWRPGQKEVASSVYRTILRRKKLFIQAPTGTGKTLSTVFPAVKAVGEGKANRIFYATAKTITRTVAEDAFRILRENGLHMKTVTLTAKEKICFMEETECNPDACPYAEGHFDRVNDAVYELLTEKEELNRPALEEQARKWQVCPFEMGLDAALWTDAVICDYNYIFDPRARLKRFFGEGVKGEYLFLIDEAHNLVERGRDMFSASLYKEDFLTLKKAYQEFSDANTAEKTGTAEIFSPETREISRRHQPEELIRLARSVTRALGRCSRWFSEKKRELEDSAAVEENVSPGQQQAAAWSDRGIWQEVSILSSGSENGGLGTFPVTLMNLCGLIEAFLEESQDAELNTKTLELYFQARRFLDTCDRLMEAPPRYTSADIPPEGRGCHPARAERSRDSENASRCTTANNYVTYMEKTPGGRSLLRLYCVDISENLQECLDKGISTIFFSATFLPINYYKNLLSTVKDDYAIYAQPVFDPANRLVLIGTDTSSRYRNRSPQEYRKMAEYIFRVLRAKRGNYMVFFSSYQMMDDVADQFDAICIEEDEPAETVRQMNRMSEEEREAFLEKFETVHPQGLVGICVMGGIFGEGIDLREDRLIGAVIVGAGLPQVCTEREILKRFYDERGEDGFFYAYLCPGMNRVLQSAGRVIRTESDRGVILLLDERFAAARYRSMFPVEWEHPGICTLKNVGEKMEKFWRK